ncbi:MAG: flavodoxin-dependent (E)-4-hydroxy-3-methylbut-2-enyl-diphosphate synthase [bacterium]
MKTTRRIYVGNVPIGGGAPIVVQSMTKTRTEDVRAAVAQIRRLEAAGCEIVRVAVPHKKALRALPEIKSKTGIPLIADIHFSKELATGALELGADAIRINPGNLGGLKEFGVVARCAARLGRAVRIGVNAGSLETEVAKNENLSEGEKLVRSALNYVEAAERYKLTQIKVSMKSFDVPATVAAYREFSSLCDVPLHVGITEAGDVFSGAIRSAVGLGILLSDGIGDTLRVSLTAPPEREVEAAWEILRSLNLRRRGVEIVSCPACGRCDADVARLLSAVKRKTKNITKNIRIAVMGCEVNGPGEAAGADIGIALNRSGGGTLFQKGVKTKKVRSERILDAFIEALEDAESM